MEEVEIVVENDVLEETMQIAAQMGLTLDDILDVLLRKFNAEEGFFFPVDPKEIELMRKQNHLTAGAI